MIDKNFEDYLMDRYIISENPLDDMIPDGFADWLQGLEVDLWIAYAEQYRNIAVDTTIDNLGGM